jgi:hypothetical protein
MSYSSIDELLNSLLNKGLITEEAKADLELTFDDYISNLADNEVKLLEEVSIIEEKISNNNPLTYLENTFWNFFIKTYSIT